LTRLFSETGIEPEPEPDLSDFLLELLGYHAMSPSTRAESFWAFTQLAAWESLDSPASDEDSPDPLASEDKPSESPARGDELPSSSSPRFE